MTATNYIRLFDFFKQQFNLEKPNAEVFVGVVEEIVEEKFEVEKNNFSPRTDIQDLKHEMQLLRSEMQLLRQETKTAVAEAKSELKSDINKLIIWIVSTAIAIVGLLLAFLKF